MGISRILTPILVFSLLLADSWALVPLIAWSNSNEAFSGVKGNQFSSPDDFLYSASLDNIKMIIIFKSPELSFDSLARYGGVYGESGSALSNLQSEVKNSKSSVWAGADGTVASDLVNTLTFLLNTFPLVITDADDLKFHNLVEVELPAIPGEEGFSAQDAVISSVMSAVHSLPDSPSYAAIYTSSYTHLPDTFYDYREIRSVDEKLTVYRQRRESEDVEDVEDVAFDNSPICASVSNNTFADICLLFCLSDAIAERFELKFNDSSYNFTGRKFPNDRSKFEEVTEAQIGNFTFMNGSCESEFCDEYDVSAPCLHLTAKVNGSDPPEEVDLWFGFPRGKCVDEEGGVNLTCGFWTMEVFIDGNKYLRNVEEENVFSEFSIPKDTSYACGKNDLNIFVQKATNDTDRVGVRDAYKFYGIQVQAQSNSIRLDRTGRPSFSPVFNCQGYLTTVPLMGLMTVLVLLIILYCSVAFIFSIQSLDRFDDARGPTITVENLH